MFLCTQLQSRLFRLGGGQENGFWQQATQCSFGCTFSYWWLLFFEFDKGNLVTVEVHHRKIRCRHIQANRCGITTLVFCKAEGFEHLTAQTTMRAHTVYATEEKSVIRVGGRLLTINEVEQVRGMIEATKHHAMWAGHEQVCLKMQSLRPGSRTEHRA